MAKYRIGSSLAIPSQADFSRLLDDAYKAHVRPYCLCNGEPGSPMYIACVNGSFYLKRMPNTGKQHATNCTSWDTPDELSGRADLIGTAISYDEEKIVIKLGFPLSKLGQRNMPQNNGEREEEKADVDASGKKLTFRGLLHFVWQEAGLVKWDTVARSRNWSSVHPLLIDAAEHIEVHTAPLAKSLYVPEPFLTFKEAAKTREYAEKIEARRRERFRSFMPTESNRKMKPLMVVVGELKAVTQNGMGGHQVTLKHLPDYRFLLDAELFKNIHSNWGTEINMWTTDSKNKRRIILGATCAVLPEGVAQLERVCLMLVNDQWIPFDTLYQEELLSKLQAAGRSFTRALRYNHSKASSSLAAWLNDAGQHPIALHIVANEEELQQAIKDTADSPYERWYWNVSESLEVPAFPIQMESPTQDPQLSNPQANNSSTGMNLEKGYDNLIQTLPERPHTTATNDLIYDEGMR